MSEEHTCFRQLIARGSVVQVERCTCGTLHLVMGPFTLRLGPNHFQTLISTLLEAQSVLAERAEPDAEPGNQKGNQKDAQKDAQNDAGFNLASILSRTAVRGES